MSKNVAVFVDVANLYYSARGQDVDVDYVALLKTATKGRDLIRAYAYSGLDPENENQRKFIDFLKKNGYMVLTKDIRKFGDGRVKANLDIELVVDLFRLADRMDIAVVVSGDGDFAPAIKALQDKGVRCEVISFRPNTSSDLIAVADEFIDIMKIAGIGRGSKEAKAQRGMSAPEMPAKEVVPEFGFREASPSVAQAALAALRDGGESREGRRGATSAEGGGRGRSRSSSAVRPVEEPAEPVAAGEARVAADEGAVAQAEGEPRRRRRRGGRGRGRGRGRAQQEGGEVAAEPGEIGWVELDDLSQLAELEGVSGPEADREYTFEEADEATLAELGLTAPQAADEPGTDAAAEEPAEKKPARRRRSTKAAAETAAAEPRAAAEKPAEKKPARRRRPTKAAAEAAVEPASEADAPKDMPEDDQPKRRSRTRSSSSRTGSSRAKSGETSTEEKSDAPKRSSRRGTGTRARSTAKADAGSDEGAEGGEETEGIWKRFRTAREGGRTAT